MQAERSQVRRAWTLLVLGFLILASLLILSASAVHAWVTDATQPRTATLEVVSGQSLLIRSRPTDDWRLVSGRVTVNEGDTITTGAATAGWLTLFDQSTVEIAENSIVEVRRMRTSRMFRDQKEIELEPIRGTIYVGMAPRGEFSSSVLRVQSGPVTVRMRDEIRVQEAGSFLVEAQRVVPDGDQSDPLLAVRVAVLRGQASVESVSETHTLHADQQLVFDASGAANDRTTAVRELVRNGDFSRHFADWVEYHDPPNEGGANPAVIERVPVDAGSDPGVAVQISRPSGQFDSWEAGIQQAIGQTLRVHSSLTLRLDIRIDEQQPAGGGDQLSEFPLIVLLEYVDVQGQSRNWSHGFYVLQGTGQKVPEDRATLVQRGVWAEIEIDLRNLSPLPRRIGSLTIYSSGHSYRALVSNVSLTSSEAGDEEYD